VKAATAVHAVHAVNALRAVTVANATNATNGASGRRPRRCLAIAAAAAAVAIALAGCASRQTAPATSQPAAGADAAEPLQADPPLAEPERLLAGRAARAEAQGRWADAALAWEALSLLRPQDQRIGERLRATRQRIDQLAGERQAAAAGAQRRGDLDGAVQAYLDVLALDPEREAAADALRQIERERTRRSAVGRFSATPAPRRADAEPPASAQAGEAARTANSQREHATMLARQGDIDGAIQLLRDSAALRHDAAQRALLADLYVQKAESLRLRQPDQARQAVNAALALDRRHPGALALQSQLGPRAGGNTRP